jgi:hypothetical protein
MPWLGKSALEQMKTYWYTHTSPGACLSSRSVTALLLLAMRFGSVVIAHLWRHIFGRKSCPSAGDDEIKRFVAVCPATDGLLDCKDIIRYNVRLGDFPLVVPHAVKDVFQNRDAFVG